MFKNYQNSYYRRRNSYSYSNSNYSNQMASQIAAQIAKTLVTPSNSFFPGGGEDIGRILSKPEIVTSLHTPETIMVEKEVITLMETESFKVHPEGTEGRGGGYSQRGPIKDIFASVKCSRSRLFGKKRSNADLHKQSPSGEILERKYKIQRVSGKQERNKNNGQENQGRDSQQSIDRDGQKVTKMVQSIQISSKIEWGLLAGSGYAGGKSIHEANTFQMEGTPTLEQLLMKNDFAISYNLKETYNHIPVHPTMQDLLGTQYQG
jgi:hypothetical protein